MRKIIRNGIISSLLILVFSLSFLILIISIGPDGPSSWGFVAAHKCSLFVFNAYTYSIVVSFLALPCWGMCVYSFYAFDINKKSGKAILTITLTSIVCLIVVYTIELAIVRYSLTGSPIDENKYYQLVRLDNLMFYFDNIGYFLYGLSSIFILTIIDANFKGLIQKISLILFGLASMAGLPGVILNNKILMLINLIGMAVTYPLAGGAFLNIFIKLRSSHFGGARQGGYENL